jgi:hypothetical protein
MMEIARLYARGYGLKNVDFKAIEAELDKRTELMYPYRDIPGSKLTGSWENSRYGTFTLEGNGEGHFVPPRGNQTKEITYENHGSWLSLRVEGEERERTFYLRKDDRTLYELITEDNRWKSRRNDYRKL